MENFEIKNIYDDKEEGEIDKTVGIKITLIAGEDDFGLFLTEIEPTKKIKAHYHKKGTEIYQIVSGSGEIRISKNENINNWKIQKMVKKGDCFSIKEGEIHQLVNKGEEKLVLLFVCPKTHLSSDRTVVNFE